MKKNILLYIFKRVPLQSHVLIIFLSYISSYLLYCIIAGPRDLRFDLSIITGFLTLFLLFIQLRLVDDIDDLKRDYPEDTPENRQKIKSLKKKLMGALITCILLILICNILDIWALIIAVITVFVSVTGTFVFRKYFPKSLIVGFFVYEGAPALIFLYIYFNWAGSINGIKLSAKEVALVVTLFLIGFEYWKFSRKVNVDVLQPYFLSLKGIRVFLTLSLVSAFLLSASFIFYEMLSLYFKIFVLCLPIIFIIWSNVRYPVKKVSKDEAVVPHWAGFTFLSLFEIGIIAEWIRIVIK